MRLLVNVRMNPATFGRACIVELTRATRRVTAGALPRSAVCSGVWLLIGLLVALPFIALPTTGWFGLSTLFGHTPTIFCGAAFGNGVGLSTLIGSGIFATAPLTFATTLVFRPAARLTASLRLVAMSWLDAQPTADRWPKSEQVEQYPMRLPAFMAGFVTSS